MRNIFCIIWLIILLNSCTSTKTLKPFSSDGCSLFPDRSLIDKEDWGECCFEHDIAYWKGGTKDERLKADEALRECVKEKTGNVNLANVIYQGVRSGGSPYFYNWYRWGYDWGYDRKYKKLTVKEKKEVENKLKEYFSRNIVHPCS